MLITRRRMLASVAGTAAWSCVAGRGRGAPATAPPADENGWIKLFDGKSLDGWHKNPRKIGHGTGGLWTVEPEGVLAGEQDPPGSGNGGILLTDRKFGEFELELELRPTWGVDSGVFLRCTDRGQCFQMMVDYYDRGSVGQMYGEATGGWGARTFRLKGELHADKLLRVTTVDPTPLAESGLVASCTPEEWVEAWKIDDWNAAHIRVEGGALPKITTHLNGLEVCVFDAAATKADKFDGKEIAETLGAEGSIAVQVHGGERYPAGAKTRFRNIRVRPL